MPSQSRRRFLAAAPVIVATLGGAAIATEIGVDPALAAITAWEAARVRAEESRAAFDEVDEAHCALVPRPNYVELVSTKHFDLESFDADPLAYIRSPQFIAAKRAELEAIIAARAEAERRTGYAVASGAYYAALDAKRDAEDSILDASPTTHAGAVALLTAVAEIAEEAYRDDESPRLADTIRRAVAVLQGKA